MKKEENKVSSSSDNSFGTASVILGIFSILFSSPPIYGVILGIISLVFANKQIRKHRNSWSKAGKILAIIGIIVSLLFFLFLIWAQYNPELYAQIMQRGIAQNA